VLLIGELLGLRPWFERGYDWASGPFVRLWDRIDSRLLAASALPPGGQGRAPRWQLYIHLMLRRFRRRVRPASTTARQVRTGILLAIVLLTLVVIGLRVRAYFRDPLYQVNSYYDDLDFRRFEDAYSRMNPATRPTFDQYLLNLSVQGGLVASYAKLDSLYTTVLAADEEQMRVQVDTRYITALSYYTDTQTLVLTNHPDEGWRIEPAALDVRVPPDQFLRRPAVEWLSVGGRSATTSVNDFTDLLDRPDLAILSARLVKQDLGPKGVGYSLVGEVMNTDVDPADVTVSGYIYDDQDELLTWYNAGAGMMHKLFPQEITPFRVDFEGVAGLALEDTRAPIGFSPDAVWTYVLPSDKQLGRFDVFAKAVVTQRDLDRDVGFQGLQVHKGVGGYQLSGTLVNTGIKEAVIPHLLVTYYDAQGEVAWVDDFFLPQALRPQRTMSFAVDLTPAAAITNLAIDSGSYSNTLQPPPVQPPPRADWLGLPSAMGYAYLRVSLHYFTGVQ
jgi:hypothetical protein